MEKEEGSLTHGKRGVSRVLPGVKSGDWRVLVDKEWARRGGEQGEEHSVLPGVKSGGLEGICGQIGAIRDGGEGDLLRPSRGEKWWVEG